MHSTTHLHFHPVHTPSITLVHLPLQFFALHTCLNSLHCNAPVSPHPLLNLHTVSAAQLLHCTGCRNNDHHHLHKRHLIMFISNEQREIGLKVSSQMDDVRQNTKLNQSNNLNDSQPKTSVMTDVRNIGSSIVDN